jgi:hypothetical protein
LLAVVPVPGVVKMTCWCGARGFALCSFPVIRDDVTARIIQALESNLLPWRRPWRTTVGGSQPGRHSNVTSKKPYQGVNPLLLELHAMRHGFQSRWWGSFPMWKSLGCNIRKAPDFWTGGRESGLLI